MTALNLGEIVATTLRNRNPSLADNITNDNWLLSTLDSKGKIKSPSGGRTLVEPLAYAANASVQWYDGYETFDISEQADQIDAAEYDWKQLGGFALVSGKEQIMNSGKYAALSLVKSRMDVLEMTLKNEAGTAMYADGTGTSGKEFGGLQLLIADDPTAIGTVGGIDQVANAWWRNQVSSVSGGLTSTNVTGQMNNMWLACRRGKDAVDTIAADYVGYTAYEESLQQQQRFAKANTARAGFESLQYKTADVIADDQCPAGTGAGNGGGRMYFVNCDYLYLQCAKQRKFSVGKTRTVENADYTATPIWLMGNLTCSNRARQGVIFGAA